jgi:hypothetical protein
VSPVAPPAAACGGGRGRGRGAGQKRRRGQGATASAAAPEPSPSTTGAKRPAAAAGPQCVWRENRRVFEALNRMCAVSKELYLLC